MYGESCQPIYAIMRVLFWCLFRRCKATPKLHARAETFRQDTTYSVLFLVYDEVINEDKKRHFYHTDIVTSFCLHFGYDVTINCVQC